VELVGTGLSAVGLITGTTLKFGSAFLIGWPQFDLGLNTSKREWSDVK